MMDVVALEELLIDFACMETDETGYPVMATHSDGAPANFLAAINKFGGKTALIAKVGDDTFGNLITATLRDAAIDTRGIVHADDVFTTLAFVTFNKEHDRQFSFSRKPGADTCLHKEEIDASLIDRAKVFRFGTLSLTDEPARSATRYAVAYAKQQGKLISFDPNFKKPLWHCLDDAKEQMLWGLGQADIVKISDEEVAFLFGDGNPISQAKMLLAKYPAKLVYVTLGKHGCAFANAKASGMMSAYNEEVVVKDTTGADDIFGGSAMWAFLQSGKVPDELSEEELRHIVWFATVSAGLSTTKAGGVSSVPTFAEVQERMKR